MDPDHDGRRRLLSALPTVAGSAALTLLVLLHPACSGSVPELPGLGPDAVILAFGDSLTSGTGASREHSYPAVLEALSGRRVVNAGVPGELSAEGLARLPRVLDEHGPDLLLLCHGGNDLLGKASSERLAHNRRGMVRAARLRGIPVVLIGVPEPGLFPRSADLYGEIAEEHGLPFEGEVLPRVESDPSLKSDYVHPNGEGYRKVAEAVHALLREAGAL